MLDFEITSAYNDTNINFTVTFKNPYLYGLLNKKSDRLVIYLKATAAIPEMIYNVTENEFGVNLTRHKISLQFDYRNEKMYDMQ